MSLKLDRLQRAISLVDRDGLPSSQFQIFWQRTMEAIEGSINGITELLIRMGVVEAAAEDIRVDLDETQGVPVLLQSASAKFGNGFVLTSTPTITISSGAGSIQAAFTGDTDDVAEGGGNLYFTNVRARTALSNGTGMSYDASTGVIAVGAKLAAYAGGDTPSAFTLGIVDSADAAAWLTALSAVSTSRSISTGTGLVGGGNLSLDRTLSLATSGVTAGNYGTATKIPTLTVDTYGRVTIASENTIPVLASSTYTPTLTNATNVSGSTAYPARYKRVGNTVWVSGKIDIQPTASGSAVVLGISLPIVSNFGNDYECSGTAATFFVAGQAGGFWANPASDRAELVFIAQTNTNQGMSYQFSYDILP